MLIFNFQFLIFNFFLVSCTPQPPTDLPLSAGTPPIYPDYADVTLPPNIAPLNFLVRGEVEAVEAIATCGQESITVRSRGNKIIFKEKAWHQLLANARGKDISVTLSALLTGSEASSNQQKKWKKWQFQWHVAPDSIDPYLTYRLIEPDYEIFQNLELRERNIENFSERPISTYRLLGNNCMNCHIYGSQSPQTSMFYVRGEGGGAILNEGGKLRKLNLKTADMVSSSVYFNFSPSGRYVCFSTNIIVPAFHAKPSKRLEVYDSKSDVYIADLKTNRIISSPLCADTAVYETFPTFSPDGRYLYYCAAPQVSRAKDLQYRLCRIPFDEKTGQLGSQVDTINTSEAQCSMPNAQCLSSVSHPRFSPDGRYLLYTAAAYGTFPIWHPEADLRLIDMQTGAINPLQGVNSPKGDTWHSWSSNSRWFVFASKRDDGLYGKPYFCYIDKSGRAHKPFVLPQRDPAFYDDNLKSFNVPELGKGPLPFDVENVKAVLKKDAEEFHR